MANIASALARLDEDDRERGRRGVRDHRPGPRRRADPARATSTASTRRSSGSPASSTTIVDVGEPLGVARRAGREAAHRRLRGRHSTQVIAVDADDEVPVLWTEGTSAADLAADIHRLLA